MSKWTRETLVCPKCGYDVGQTVDDGIERCPECGHKLDPESLKRREDDAPELIRRGVYGAAIITAGWPTLAWVCVEWLHTNLPMFALTMLPVVCIVPCVALEKWMQGNRPAGGAVDRGVSLGLALFVGSILVGALVMGALMAFRSAA